VDKVVVVGSLNMDTNLSVPHIPVVGETIIAKGMSLFKGGKGANQAVAIARLGGDVEMIGAVGDDDNGRKIISGMKKEKVGTAGLIVKENTPTGIAIISVAENGDNNIIVHSGANYQLGKEDIDKNLDLIKAASYCVLQLEIPLEVVRYTIDICYKNNVQVILNPAPVVAEIDAEILSKVEYLLPNESELNIIAGKEVSEEKMIESCREIIAKGCQNVIVTLGDKGSLWVTENGYRYFEAMEVNAVDTTAAGDSFIGAFTYMLAQGKDVIEAIEFATRAAAITVTRKGAQDSLPVLAEVL